MFSAALQNQLIQTRVYDRHRQAAESSRRAAARRQARSVGEAANEGSKSTRQDHRRTYRFLRHYVEMVVVMFAGMFILMVPTDMLLRVFGTSSSDLSPAMNLFVMALTMTVPMVAWMSFRGHSWRANIEMAASMLIPTFAAMAVLWAGAAKGTLMVPEHVGMLACMLVAMLLRRDEYSCAKHHHDPTRPAVAA